MPIKIQLSILSIMAFIQPFVFFYWLDNYLSMWLYCFLGVIFTCICIVKSYSKWRINGLFDLVWSLLIPVLAILSLSFLDVYRIDAQIFMSEREAILRKIKNAPDLIEQLDYTHNSFLPVSIKNYVELKGTGNQLTLYFKTVDDSFFNIYERGVLYSDKPEKIDTYEKRITSEGGVVDEASFRIKKIKPHWYFYEYEIRNISD